MAQLLTLHLCAYTTQPAAWARLLNSALGEGRMGACRKGGAGNGRIGSPQAEGDPVPTASGGASGAHVEWDCLWSAWDHMGIRARMQSYGSCGRAGARGRVPRLLS